MATQLKPDDFIRTATPTPNIRIAFENGPAVVAINRVLADAPASQQTLDELAGQGAISVAPWLGTAPRLDPSPDSLAAASFGATDGAISLPAVPAGASKTMVDFVNGYRRAFFSTAETAGDEVEAAADIVRLYPAMTIGDLAAKLIVAIHHAHPSVSREGLIAVDPTDFECTQAGELMMSTLADAMRLARGAASNEPASPAISDISYAATPTGNRTFDDAYALYASLRQAELAFPDTNNDRDLEAALGEACDRTDAAFRTMLAVPVTDHQRAALKVGAAFERYDIAKSGLLEEGEGALLLQAAQILRETGMPTPSPVANAPTAAAADRTEWDANLAAYRLANEAFTAANAPYAQMFADDPQYEAAEAVSNAAMDIDTAAERVLFATPAPDLAAARTKLDIALGANVQIEDVKSLADDLRRIAEAAEPDDYDRFMRGPLIQWNLAYDRYIRAQAERAAYDTAEVTPAAARYDAVRQIWPANYAFADDPIAAAAIEAVNYDAVERRYEDLCSEERDALRALLRKVAPSQSELATKLELFEANEIWGCSDVAEIVSAIVSDARRFGKHGAFKLTDRALLEAHSGLRADATDWFDRGAYNDERDTERSEKVAALEATIWKERATTIEGVLVKLTATFPHIVIEAWSDRAVLDPQHPAFRDGLAKTSVDYQALWSAIDDLARIGGVNLAEVGA